MQQSATNYVCNDENPGVQRQKGDQRAMLSEFYRKIDVHKLKWVQKRAHPTICFAATPL